PPACPAITCPLTRRWPPTTGSTGWARAPKPPGAPPHPPHFGPTPPPHPPPDLLAAPPSQLSPSIDPITAEADARHPRDPDDDSDSRFETGNPDKDIMLTNGHSLLKHRRR